MYQLIANNLGVSLLAGAGILVGIGLIVDNVIAAFRSWEPIEVDRGRIVEVDQ